MREAKNIPEEFLRLHAEDCREVAALEAQCFPNAWSEEQYRALAARGGCGIFGLRREGRLVAYIALGMPPGLPEMEIYNIGVAEGERRKGLGKKLLRLALEAAAGDGVEQVLLEVRESNTAAIALYEGAGFTQAGKRPGYYSNPREDALVYICDCTRYAKEKG